MAPEMFDKLTEPMVNKLANGLEFSYLDEEHYPTVQVRDIHNTKSSDITCELTFFYLTQGIADPLRGVRFNLNSMRTRKDMAKTLREWLINPSDLFHDKTELIIEDICWRTLKDYRTGTPAVNIDEPPTNPMLEYQLYPLLVKGLPTTIYSPGDFGKSIIAQLITVLVQFNVSALGWLPTAGNVLYLDWEEDEEKLRRYITAIKKGLDITESQQILYRSVEHDLTEEIASVKALVIANKIDLVIIDSQMAATAEGKYGADSASVSSMYYNALRELHCTSLTLDHTTKVVMDGAESSAPYGSVVKFNRSRSQFELKHTQEAGDDFIDLCLVHRKFNLGIKQKPIGIHADFTNNDNVLERITFSDFDVANNAAFFKIQSRTDRLVTALKGMGRASIKELAEAIGEPENERIIGVTLSKDKKRFVRLQEGIYGLLTHQSNLLS